MYHYKDQPPLKTITHIRGLLESLGIMVMETQWETYKNRIFSVRIAVEGTRIGSNGKGISPQFALASAFGEFMERLQNQYLFPLISYYHFDRHLSDLHGFCFSPDEVYMSVSDFVEKTDRSILEHFLPRDLGENEPAEVYLDILSHMTPPPHEGTLLCVPYYSVTTDSLVFLPPLIASSVYGSNGMCAGNTEEEALVQGLCEIIERYVNKTTILQNLCLPDVSAEMVSTADIDLLSSVEEHGEFAAFIKDGSLGEELPVVGVALINRVHSTYLVKFGSHPESAVALERALTELFQGRSLKPLERGEDMVPFEYVLDESCEDPENIGKVITTGEGRYNSDFFSNSFSYLCNEKYYKGTNVTSNREYLSWLIHLISKKGWDILVRDVSFLGFPSFHIVIPGVSEIQPLLKNDIIEIEKVFEVSRLVKDINTCTEEELRKIAHVVENKIKKGEDGTLAELTKLPSSDEFLWQAIDFYLLLSTVYLRLGHIEKARTYRNQYILRLENSGTAPVSNRRYHKCVRDYLALLEEHTEPTKEKMHILERIYGDELVSRVKESISPPHGVFKYYGTCTCPQCSSCFFKPFCSYEKIREIQVKIKGALAGNFIDQYKKNRVLWSEFVPK